MRVFRVIISKSNTKAHCTFEDFSDMPETCGCQVPERRRKNVYFSATQLTATDVKAFAVSQNVKDMCIFTSRLIQDLHAI